MSRKHLIVPALGGNAISREDQEGNVEQQFANSSMTAKALADLIEAGHQTVITHGNGPQIGNFLLRNEAATGAIYALPMEVAVAHVQGGMGYMIAQTLTNELHDRGIECVVTTMITTVLVDADDDAFRDPAKPIGRVLSKEEADHFALHEGWHIKEISPGRYRRTIASPIPKRIMEIDAIRRAVGAGDPLVVCGGGGIPVVRHPQIGLVGVRAVIDKDLVSAMLAVEIGADAVIFLTSVDHVCLNYSQPDERAIDHMTVAEARRRLEQGQFPPGSMGPKIQAAIDFLTRTANPDALVVIGPLHRAADAFAGRVGTRITKA